MSMFPHTARLINFLPAQCFPLTQDQIYFEPKRVDTFYGRALLGFLLFSSFLVTACLLIAVQPCTELIPLKKNKTTKFYYTQIAILLCVIGDSS